MAAGKSITRELVLEKAIDMAKEEGIDQVTYNGLARELNIRPQSMYRYISNLKELRIEVLSYFLNDLTDKIEAAITALPPAEALIVYAITMYDTCHSSPWYYETFDLMHRYGIVSDLTPALGRLVRLVETQMNSLHADPEAARRRAQMFIAANIGYAHLAPLESFPANFQDSRSAFVDAITEYVNLVLV